jgi:ABC-type sugar transport system substrate-binding protein
VKRLFSIIAMVLAIAMVAVACGDDDSSGDASTAAPAGGDERTARAVAAGEEAAAAAGGPVELPQKTAGILQILGSIESAQNAERNMREALDTLGWKQIVCDAQGDPTKMARCGDSLLDQGVDVMFVLGIEPSLIKAQMRKAKDQGVPVVGFGGQVGDDPLWAGKYYPDDPESGEILTDYVMGRLGEIEGDKPVAVNSYPADWSRLRTDVFLNAIKEDPSIDLVAEQTTDAANLVEGTRKQVNDTLTAHPDLKVYWFGFDVAGQAGGQAVAAKFPGKSFPEKPLVVTFDADLGTQELMRAGAIDAVVDVPYYASAWIAADQAAEFFARDTPFDQSPQPDYPITIFDNVMITSENLPPEGQLRQTEDDFVAFFTTKWENEFESSP